MSQDFRFPLKVRDGESRDLLAVLNSSARGDLFVHVEVKTPAKLSREQRKLFEQLRDTLPADNAPAGKGIFEKVKDFFV